MDYKSHFILDANGQPVYEPDLMKWAMWFGAPEGRVVRQTNIGMWRISTVFLGINHAFHGGPPVLWETMVFGRPSYTKAFGWFREDAFQDRYILREQAVAGHEKAVRDFRSRKAKCKSHFFKILEKRARKRQ